MTNGLSAVTTKADRGFLSSTEEIIEDLRNGRMVVLVDAEDRENEGDLIIPAQMATPDAVNFMAMHGRGLICLSLTEGRAKTLRLESMVPANASRTGTAFTVSIEARDGVTTGISAHDRARTIAAAIDPTKTHEDVVSPGHVFPLVAREGGVLVRAGHTEASVDLARLAGLNPSAVICEIMNDDGTMARMPDLIGFAQRHNLKIGTIEDLIAFRLRNDQIVRKVAARAVDSAFGGGFDLHVYENAVEPGEHLALVKGDLSKPGPVLVRVHAVNVLNDVLGLGGEHSSVESAMHMISEAGRGVVVLIRDLRPKSVSEGFQRKAEASVRKIQGQERRNVEIGIGSQILRDLGVSDMILMTNSPESTYVGLEAYGLTIREHRRLDDA